MVGLPTSAMSALMTSMSGFGWSSGGNRMMARASSTFTRSRSLAESGLPVRVATTVVPGSPIFPRSSESMAVLSLVAITTMWPSASLCLAIRSSRTVSLTIEDQPRITVWSATGTGDRPFARSPTMLRKPEVMIPMSMLPTSMLEMKSPALTSIETTFSGVHLGVPDRSTPMLVVQNVDARSFCPAPRL
jgi:hypothetical protein